MRILQGFVSSTSRPVLKIETGQFRKRKWNDIGAVIQIGDLQNLLRGDESFSGDGAGLAGRKVWSGDLLGIHLISSRTQVEGPSQI